MTELFSPQTLEIFKQLALAAFLGALIGVERKLAHKTAGIRTFALVSLGAAVFTIIPQVVFVNFAGTSYDPSRIASQVVVGIGFIGAGLIVFQQSKVKGLTTAAGLWVSAAIGMSVAYKLYSIAIFTTALTIVILFCLWFLEHKVIGKLRGESKAEQEDEE